MLHLVGSRHTYRGQVDKHVYLHSYLHKQVYLPTNVVERRKLLEQLGSLPLLSIAYCSPLDGNVNSCLLISCSVSPPVCVGQKLTVGSMSCHVMLYLGPML